MKPVLDKRLADPDAEQVRRSHAEAIRDAQARLPVEEIIADVRLSNAVETPVRHNLGRPPKFVTTSVVAGAGTPGVINEFRDRFSSGAPIDRSKFVVIRADGYGATIRVDVKVQA